MTMLIASRIVPQLNEEFAILHCVKAKRDDTGKYQLALKNSEGTETISLNVNVLGEWICNNSKRINLKIVKLI